MEVTKKLYYEDPFQISCEALVEEVSGQRVRLNQTVAFPEGGGQEPDYGFLELPNGDTIAFLDVQKGAGRLLTLPDFPTIQVDTPIYHLLREEFGAKLVVGMKVKVRIDVERRARISTSHSAAHLVFVGVEKVRPSLGTWLRGCSIGPDTARFDFRVDGRFSEEEIQEICQIANQFVKDDLPIRVYHHPDEPEAWYWECRNEIIPCGGTHLTSTGSIGNMVVRRRSKGKDLERLIIEFPNANLSLDVYHE